MNVCPKCKKYVYVPKYHIYGHCPKHGYVKPVPSEIVDKKKRSNPKIEAKNQERKQRADIRDGGRKNKSIKSKGRG